MINTTMEKKQSIFEAAAAVLNESSSDPWTKALAAYKSEREGYTKGFYKIDAEMEAIKAKAKTDVAELKKLRDKETQNELRAFSRFKPIAAKLGWEFGSLPAGGGVGWKKMST